MQGGVLYNLLILVSLALLSRTDPAQVLLGAQSGLP
jgi:hypothetical protein